MHLDFKYLHYSYYRTLCGVILFLCFVGTVLDIASDCLKPTSESSLSKNDGFMPIKHGQAQYDSAVLNSASRLGDYDSGSSIPLLLYEKQEGKE